MLKNPFTVRNMPYIAILAGIEIVLQFAGNYIAFGPVSINLSLVPIALGAIIFGPWCGLFLGILNALFVLMAPSTSLFYNISVIGTILICLLKSGLAGFLGGLFHSLIKNKNELIATVVASITLPVVNTGIFCVGCLTFFRPFLESAYEGAGFSNIFLFLFVGMIGWNFVFELTSSALLTYPIYRIVAYFQRRRQNALA